MSHETGVIGSLSNRGFTMIEALAAVAIVGVLVLVFSNLTMTTLKTQKGIALTDDLSNTIQLVRMNLRKSAVCQVNIPHLNPQTFDRTALNGLTLNMARITALDGTPLVTSNSALPNRPGSMVQIRVQNLREVIPNSDYMGDLAFFLQKGPGVMGAQDIVRTLPILFNTTAAGNIQTITGCSALDSSVTSQDIAMIERQVCESMSGTWTPGDPGTCTPPSLNAAQVCGAMGGIWTGTVCDPPPRWRQDETPLKYYGQVRKGVNDNARMFASPNNEPPPPPCEQDFISHHGYGCSPIGYKCYTRIVMNHGFSTDYEGYSCGGAGPDSVNGDSGGDSSEGDGGGDDG